MPVGWRSLQSVNRQVNVRHLLQPRVLNSAVPAALVSALASYPRLSLWPNRSAPVWYLEGMIFLCSIVLWGFVFAWHTHYTRRPVFALKIQPRLFAAATAIGIATAAAFHQWLDPSLRAKIPEEYPADLTHWLAQLLFVMLLSQLFLLFASFAWLMRLCKNLRVSASLTVLFGVGVFAMRMHTLTTPLPPPLMAVLLAGKVATGFLAVWFYLRGGVLLIWWWTFLFEARHLLNLNE